MILYQNQLYHKTVSAFVRFFHAPITSTSFLCFLIKCMRTYFNGFLFGQLLQKFKKRNCNFQEKADFIASVNHLIVYRTYLRCPGIWVEQWCQLNRKLLDDVGGLRHVKLTDTVNGSSLGAGSRVDNPVLCPDNRLSGVGSKHWRFNKGSGRIFVVWKLSDSKYGKSWHRSARCDHESEISLGSLAVVLQLV